MSIRNRLALTYSVLLVCTGLAMIAAVNVTVQVMNGALIDRLYTVAIATVLVIAGLGAFASWLVAGWMLRPLQRLDQVVRQIDETTLDTRLDFSGPDDEIRSLAASFDVLLSRLQAAFSSRALFAANASHELRTPLTTMKTLLQVALRDPKTESAAELRSTLERLLTTVDSMTATTEALLRLAESRHLAEVQRVDLSRVIEEEGAKLAPLIGDLNLSLTVRTDAAVVAGDSRLMHDLVGNLFRNAVIHNREGGALEVSTTTLPERRVQLRVRNTGDVVAEDRIPFLTEPFYRTHLRTRGSGHGLGLAIVAAVADAHDADLTIRPNAPDGLDVTVTFPDTPSA